MSAFKTIKGYELHERFGSSSFGVVHRTTQSTIGAGLPSRSSFPTLSANLNSLDTRRGQAAV